MATQYASNIDAETVADFGKEWASFDQTKLSHAELHQQFGCYFSLFDFENAGEGFDLGCGSGRWAQLVAPRVRRLHCIDPATDALAVARKTLSGHANVVLHHGCADTIPLPDNSQDFGYSLGVLHHVPDPEAAMRNAVRKLKPGAQFLVYLYYRFDNRPAWFRGLWRVSDIIRKGVCRLPFPVKKALTSIVAATVYYPLARSALLLEKAGCNVESFPLSPYRVRSFYSMRTDALDRFGTRLEHRFTQAEIRAMMERCGLTGIRFSEGPPCWVAHGIKP